MSKEKYKPAKRTIGPAILPRQWSSGTFHTCRPYKISRFFTIPKLRGAIVYITGPESWEDAKVVNKVLIARKTPKFTVRLKQLAEGKTSKKFVQDYKFVIHMRYLVEIF